MAARLFNLMLCALLAGPLSLSAWAVARPENRVGGSPVFSSDFASQENAKPIGARGESAGCGYDFASGVHKYLYTEDDPVMGTDPSGHDDLVELMTTMTISSGLSAMISPVISYAGQRAVVGLIPQRVENSLASAAIPDAILFGVSGTTKSKYAVGGTGGLELLVSPKTLGWAAYGYLGGAFNASAGVQGTFGFVFDCPQSSDYTRFFTTISVPYRRLPLMVQRNVDRFLASGFGATVGGSSPEFIQEAQSIGAVLSDVVDKSTINIFFDSSLKTKGFSFSHPAGPATSSSSSRISLSFTWYWQLAPDRDVRFR